MEQKLEQNTRPDTLQSPVIPEKKASPLIWTALACSVVAMMLSIGALRMVWPAPQPEPEPIAEEENVPAISGVDYITYKDHQLPVEELPVSAWAPEGVAKEKNGWLSYQSGDVTAVQGIDVSAHQGKIDWEAVAQSGVDFAIIRAGYRGYGEEGRLVLDEYFHPNMQGALNAGLDVGVYFFSQATTVLEAEEEAKMLLEVLEGYRVTYPVVFDWERIHHSVARTDGVVGKTVALMAETFCGLVEQAGYVPGVYFNQNLGYLSLELEELSNCVFWLAEYDDRPDFYYHADLWQYSCTGTVPGIDTPVDLDLSYRDFGQQEDERD